jgi:glycosyltransferase involved in cell wall biosynthesis
MPNIVMLLSNAFRPDMRVMKEAVTLAEAGYTVTIVCWDRLAELPKEESLASGVRVLRIHNVQSSYGAGARQVFNLPRFWSAAVHQAIALKPDLVHCHDLDTLYAGVRIKHQLGSKLVFDAHEDYPTQMSLYLPGFSRPLLNGLERWLLKQVDGVLAASSFYLDKLARLGLMRPIYLPNVPDLDLYERIGQSEIEGARRELGLSREAYVIGYIGGFSRNRLLIPLVEAVHAHPEVTLLLAGEGHQRGALEESIRGMANVRYLGWLAAEKVPLHTRLCDVIYYCLRPDYPGAMYNASNALSNAMAAGKPVIANNLGDLGRIVQKTGGGILLEPVNPETVAGAIQKLSDPAIRQAVGNAGYIAAKAEYNWQAVRQRLVNLYAALLR